jgi:hypothetical protein
MKIKPFNVSQTRKVTFNANVNGIVLSFIVYASGCVEVELDLFNYVSIKDTEYDNLEDEIREIGFSLMSNWILSDVTA